MPFNASFPLLTNSGSGIFTLEDLFKQLSYGELSNLAVAVEATGTIKKEKQNQIVHFTNEALKKLHARLPLKEDSVTLTLAGVELDYEFDEDVLVVTSIMAAHGESVPFETVSIPDRIVVRGNPLNIHFPEGFTGEAQVSFRNRHPVLNPVTTGDDLTQEIELLPEIQPALTAYIASRVYAGMNSQDSMALSNGYRMQYEQAIADVLNAGILPGELLPHQKLETRGFV